MPSSAAAQPLTPMPRHTPGLRSIHERRLHPGISIEVRDPEGVCISTMVYRGEDAEGIETTRADARLDAAGPDLLDVVRQFEWCIDVRGVGKCCPNCGGEEIDGHRAGCALGAAIRKATEGA